MEGGSSSYGGSYQPSLCYTPPCLSIVIQILPVQASLKTHQGLANRVVFSLRFAVCCQVVRRLRRPW